MRDIKGQEGRSQNFSTQNGHTHISQTTRRSLEVAIYLII